MKNNRLSLLEGHSPYTKQTEYYFCITTNTPPQKYMSLNSLLYGLQLKAYGEV